MSSSVTRSARRIHDDTLLRFSAGTNIIIRIASVVDSRYSVELLEWRGSRDVKEISPLHYRMTELTDPSESPRRLAPPH